MGKYTGATSVHRLAIVRKNQSTDNSANYKDGFEVAVTGTDTRTAEQWLRAAFEDASLPVRWFLLLGWRWVLGLRLGPRPSPDYILGWRITTSTPEEIRIELLSALMKAQLALHLSNSTAIWSTQVYYKRLLARPLWEVVGVIHRRIVPYLLGRAASFPLPKKLSADSAQIT